MNILAKFPIRVGYPDLEGEHFLLEWSTSYDRGHVIVALRKHQLLDVWNVVLNKHESAKPVACWQIRIVRPSDYMYEIYANRKDEEQRSTFANILAGIIRDPVEYTKKWAPGTSECANPLNDDGTITKKDDDEPEYYRHWNCVNCIQGVVIEGHTAKSLYAIDAVREKVLEHMHYTDHEAQAMSAEPPTPGKKLFAVQDNHGNHADGTHVVPVKNWEKKEHWIPENVRFFFQGKKIAIPKAVKAGVEKADQEEKDYRAQQDKEAEERRRQFEAEVLGRCKAVLDLVGAR